MNYLHNISITKKWYPRPYMKKKQEKLSDLRPGHKVIVKGIEMQFSEWRNDVPVFWHEKDGYIINFSTTDFNRETLLKDIA